MKRLYTRLLSFVLCAWIALAGFGGTAAANNAPAEEWGGAETAAASGANDFAFRLSAELARATGEGNLVCSPYSVWIPLAALVNATQEGYRDALLKALGAAGITADEMNRAASLMAGGLTAPSGGPRAESYGTSPAPSESLKIANAIFISDEATLKKEFTRIFADFYRGAAMSVDFSSLEAVDAVNQWVSDHTGGLIDRIVEEFSADVILAITNAIYFAGQWNKEFNADRTEEDVFHAPDGDTTAFYMLRRGDELNYYEDDRVQAMPLAFAGGGGMCVILPKDESAVETLSTMTNGYFESIMAGAEPAEGRLLLPRFTIEGKTIELREALETLGVPLFDQKAAPLTGGLVEEDYYLWASSVLHKAVIEVDEKGATAAAVTIVQVDYAMAAPPMDETEPFEMICDKPFVFIVYGETDSGVHQVLFTGIVSRP